MKSCRQQEGRPEGQPADSRARAGRAAPCGGCRPAALVGAPGWTSKHGGWAGAQACRVVVHAPVVHPQVDAAICRRLAWGQGAAAGGGAAAGAAAAAVRAGQRLLWPAGLPPGIRQRPQACSGQKGSQSMVLMSWFVVKSWPVAAAQPAAHAAAHGSGSVAGGRLHQAGALAAERRRQWAVQAVQLPAAAHWHWAGGCRRHWGSPWTRSPPRPL